MWQASDAEAPAVQARVDAFIRDASRLDGIGDAVPAARADVSRDGTIAIARMPLTVSPGAVPLETGRELIEIGGRAQRRRPAASSSAARRSGNAQRGPISSEAIGLAIAALVLLLDVRDARRRRPADRHRAVRPRHLRRARRRCWPR